MTNSIQTIQFHNQNLLATIVDGTPHIAMKPICENIGIAWNSQLERIKRHPVLNDGMRIISTPSNGGIQDMVMLPLNMINGWLFGVDSNRIKKTDVKNKVIEYQRECFDVLANHFLPKRNALVALPKLTPKQQRHIQKRVRTLVHEQIGTTHYALWGKVKDEFQVGTYKDIPANKYPELCKFLKCKPLEGELLPKEVIPAYNYPLETVKPVNMVGNNAWLTADNLLNQASGHPIEDLLEQLEKEKFNVDGCKAEYNGLKYCLANEHSALQQLKQKTDSMRKQIEDTERDFGCLRQGKKLWFGD